MHVPVGGRTVVKRSNDYSGWETEWTEVQDLICRLPSMCLLLTPSPFGKVEESNSERNEAAETSDYADEPPRHGPRPVLGVIDRPGGS
jgi:hypothetical protein